MAQWLDGTLSNKVNWNDHLFSLEFSCPEFGEFKAGQFVKVGIELSDGKVLSRPYSLVNPPSQANPEILAVPVEEGQLSPQLHNLEVGDPVKIMQPATGFLVLEEVPDANTLWMVATGTGVGPFLSILATDTPWQRFDNIVLIYAARYGQDLAYLPLIEQWQKSYSSQFNFVPIVSREEYPTALKGRIPQLLEQGVIESRVGHQITVEDSQVMICGNPDMIKEVMALLVDKGLKKHLRRSPGQITMEQYW